MRSIRRAALFATGVAIGLCVAIFIYRNRIMVDVDYYFGVVVDVPVWTIVLTTFVAGMTLPILLHFAGVFEAFLDRRRLVKRIETLELELVELRNMPLAEAEIDLERPKPEAKTVRAASGDVEVLDQDESLPEGDLYPAVFKGKEAT